MELLWISLGFWWGRKLLPLSNWSSKSFGRMKQTKNYKYVTQCFVKHFEMIEHVEGFLSVKVYSAYIDTDVLIEINFL